MKRVSIDLHNNPNSIISNAYCAVFIIVCTCKTWYRYGSKQIQNGCSQIIPMAWPKPSCKAHWKGEEDKADKGRGGKTSSGNGQVWRSASPRGQWRAGEKWRKLIAKSSVVPQRPPRLRDWWWWWRRPLQLTVPSNPFCTACFGLLVCRRDYVHT